MWTVGHEDRWTVGHVDRSNRQKVLPPQSPDAGRRGGKTQQNVRDKDEKLNQTTTKESVKTSENKTGLKRNSIKPHFITKTRLKTKLKTCGRSPV